VSNWEQFGEWIATVVVASFAWVSGLVASGVPVDSQMAVVDVPAENELSSVLRWAQQDDEPPIEQVGEGTEGDVETLDEAAPPTDEVDTSEDVELLDQGPPAGDQQDVELLDQGPVATTASQSPVAPPVSTVPDTTYVAPDTASVPMVPQGFGTGTVHVATGSTGFPVGLEDCHVGAVTGRAYVGIDCGNGSGNMFVGHAPSFEAFPFVLDENFPFDRESVFANRGAGQPEGNVEPLISVARGATRDHNAAPEDRNSGASTVEFEQRARDRKPRVEIDNSRSKQGNEKRESRNTGVTASKSEDGPDRTSAESNYGKKKKGKDRHRGGSTSDDQKKSKDSDTTKKRDGKMDKRSRGSNSARQATDSN
jgi:hypothetical protein